MASSDVQDYFFKLKKVSFMEVPPLTGRDSAIETFRLGNESKDKGF